MDPHGAVAYLGLKEFLKSSNTDATGIFLKQHIRRNSKK